MSSKFSLIPLFIILFSLNVFSAYGPPSGMQANTNLVKDLTARSKNLDDLIINVKKKLEDTKSSCLKKLATEADKSNLMDQCQIQMIKIKSELFELKYIAQRLILDYSDSQLNHFRQLRTVALEQLKKRQQMIQLMKTDTESVINNLTTMRINYVNGQFKDQYQSAINKARIQSVCEHYKNIVLMLKFRISKNTKKPNYGRIHVGILQADRVLKDINYFESQCSLGTVKDDLLNAKSQLQDLLAKTSKEKWLSDVCRVKNLNPYAKQICQKKMFNTDYVIILLSEVSL